MHTGDWVQSFLGIKVCDWNEQLSVARCSISATVMFIAVVVGMIRFV